MRGSHDREIDLFELYIKIYYLIRKRIILIFLFVIIGILISLYNYFFVPSYYTSSMVCCSNVLSNKIIVPLVESLDKQIKQKKPISHNSEDSLMFLQIRGIKARVINADETKSVFLNNYFEIEVKIYNKNNIPFVRELIIYYINNNSYIKEKIESEKNIINSNIVQIDNELSKIDSLQRLAFKNNRSEFFYLIGNDKVQLIEKKINLQNEAQLLKGINIISDFIIPSNPSNKGILFILIIILSSFLLGFFSSCFIELHQKTKKYYQEST
ncbi:MAG: hypothetical protein HY738_14515 [Bacteroidia bacterium]|nr:hypothetical protein [Bacteroidia bacterium]